MVESAQFGCVGRLHGDDHRVRAPVLQDPQARVDPLRLEVDRVGRLGVRLDRDDVRGARRGVHDDLAEALVEREPELGVLDEVDQPAGAHLAAERQAGQDVVELEALAGLTLAEVEPGVDRP